MTDRNKLEIAVEALHCIACWNEGEEVTSSFDEPASAETAREALRGIGAVPHDTKK